MSDQEKDKEKPTPPAAAAPDATSAPVTGAATQTATEEETSQYFYVEARARFDPSEITGSLIVIEGMDGSGRSTQIALLQEWLAYQRFAVATLWWEGWRS